MMMLENQKSWDDVVTMINARYGWKWTQHDLFTLGEEVIKLERDFNLRAGFTPVHDSLPEFFLEEPLPPHNTVFDVSNEEMQVVFEL